MKIAILISEVGRDAAPDDLDTLVQAEAVAEILSHCGHQAVMVPVGLDLATARSTLAGLEPELAVNFVETVDGTARLAPLAALLLERLGIPFTGSGSLALGLSTGKLAAKGVLEREGIPTPAWVGERPTEWSRFAPGRWLVKSVWEHASLGLSDENLIEAAAPEELAKAITARRAGLGGEAYAEAYVDGREFNVGVIERHGRPLVLPPAEMRFEGFGDAPKIVGYAAKWHEDSDAYACTVRDFALPPDDAGLLETLTDLTRRTFLAFGLSGYARVDFRVDASGAPYVIDVNANPCISPDAGLTAAAERAGLSHAELVELVVQAALERGA